VEEPVDTGFKQPIIQPEPVSTNSVDTLFKNTPSIDSKNPDWKQSTTGVQFLSKVLGVDADLKIGIDKMKTNLKTDKVNYILKIMDEKLIQQCCNIAGVKIEKIAASTNMHNDYAVIRAYLERYVTKFLAGYDPITGTAKRKVFDVGAGRRSLHDRLDHVHSNITMTHSADIIRMYNADDSMYDGATVCHCVQKGEICKHAKDYPILLAVDSAYYGEVLPILIKWVRQHPGCAVYVVAHSFNPKINKDHTTLYKWQRARRIVKVGDVNITENTVHVSVEGNVGFYIHPTPFDFLYGKRYIVKDDLAWTVLHSFQFANHQYQLIQLAGKGECEPTHDGWELLENDLSFSEAFIDLSSSKNEFLAQNMSQITFAGVEKVVTATLEKPIETTQKLKLFSELELVAKDQKTKYVRLSDRLEQLGIDKKEIYQTLSKDTLIQPIDGNGACQFSTVAASLGRDVDMIRKRTVEFMQEHRDHFVDYIVMPDGVTEKRIKMLYMDAYLSDMCKSDTFGDHLTLASMSHIYEFNAHIYEPHLAKVSTVTSGLKFTRDINLLYSGKNHYDLIVKMVPTVILKKQEDIKLDATLSDQIKVEDKIIQDKLDRQNTLILTRALTEEELVKVNYTPVPKPIPVPTCTRIKDKSVKLAQKMKSYKTKACAFIKNLFKKVAEPSQYEILNNTDRGSVIQEVAYNAVIPNNASTSVYWASYDKLLCGERIVFENAKKEPIVYQCVQGQIQARLAYTLPGWTPFVKYDFTTVCLLDARWKTIVNVADLNSAISTFNKVKVITSEIITKVFIKLTYSQTNFDINLFAPIIQAAIHHTLYMYAFAQSVVESVEVVKINDFKSDKVRFSIMGNGCKGFLKGIAAKMCGRRIMAASVTPNTGLDQC
jgi:hypothetical protein